MKRTSSIFTKSENGFSLIEVMIAVGISGIVSLAMMTMISNQQRSLRGVTAKSEAESLDSTIRQILKDENSCAATVQAAAPVAPTSMAAPIVLNSVILMKQTAPTVWTPVSQYATGVSYANIVTITSLQLRDYVATDLTPGPKFEVHYHYDGDILGTNAIVRTFDAFVDFTAPSAALPTYNFRCSTAPIPVAPAAPGGTATEFILTANGGDGTANPYGSGGNTKVITPNQSPTGGLLFKSLPIPGVWTFCSLSGYQTTADDGNMFDTCWVKNPTKGSFVIESLHYKKNAIQCRALCF